MRSREEPQKTFRIEIGQAQPWERAALADQRGGMQVTNEGVVANF